MSLKNKITVYAAEQLNLNTTQKDLAKLRQTWWVNPRNKLQGGLRLTKAGLDALQKADIKFYTIQFNEMLYLLSNQQILQLDRLISCPFYMNHKKICVTDDRIAIQLILFSGDVLKFITAKNKSIKNHLTLA